MSRFTSALEGIRKTGTGQQAVWFLALLASAALLLLVLSGVGWQPAYSQAERQEYFPETGHFVQGPFLDFFLNTSDPEKVFGYPITEQFVDRVSGRTVQYFQRVRFELDESGLVVLSPLGEWLYEPEEAFPLAKNPAACRAFTETGYDVCYSFLRFYDQNGGAVRFGPPISPVEYHNERLVQYFRHARFEWHPDARAAGQEVRLTELGSIYFFEAGEDVARLRSVQGAAVQDVTGIVARAFPVRAAVMHDEVQAVYVVVQDQTLTPVEGVVVSVLARLPSGREEMFTLGQTNAFGFTSGNIPFRPDKGEVGLVELQVTVEYQQSLVEKTVTSYRLLP